MKIREGQYCSETPASGQRFPIPIGGRQSLKASYSAGATTRIGGDFKTLAVAWQMTWIRH